MAYKDELKVATRVSGYLALWGFAVVTILGLVLVISKVFEKHPATQEDARKMAPVETATVCHDGIQYFTMFNHGRQVVTGAVIDSETLQPKRCGREN